MFSAAQNFSDVLSEKYDFQASPTVEGAIGGSTDFVRGSWNPAIEPVDWHSSGKCDLWLVDRIDRTVELKLALSQPSPQFTLPMASLKCFSHGHKNWHAGCFSHPNWAQWRESHAFVRSLSSHARGTWSESHYYEGFGTHGVPSHRWRWIF